MRILKKSEVSSPCYLLASKCAPFHEDGSEEPTFVWAVYRSRNFSREWRTGLVQYHPTLGWRPQGSQGWAWEVREWQYPPAASRLGTRGKRGHGSRKIGSGRS